VFRRVGAIGRVTPNRPSRDVETRPASCRESTNAACASVPQDTLSSLRDLRASEDGEAAVHVRRDDPLEGGRAAVRRVLMVAKRELPEDLNDLYEAPVARTTSAALCSSCGRLWVAWRNEDPVIELFRWLVLLLGQTDTRGRRAAGRMVGPVLRNDPWRVDSLAGSGRITRPCLLAEPPLRRLDTYY
jgi:hypothetical protein